MPQMNNLVLTDRAATPVNHTFVPRDIVGAVATLTESTGVPIGDNRFSMSLNRTNTGRTKVSVKLAVPIVQDQTINGITSPTVVRTGYAELTLSFDNTSTEQERKNVVGMFQSALDSGKWSNDVLTKLQAVY